LRTTLICGFPGESEEDHQLNLSMIEEAGWDHLGAFTYSKEEGTPAYDKEDDVPPEVKQRRLEEVMLLQEKISAGRLKEKIGSVQEVMVEKYDRLTEMYIGRSALYAPDDVDGCVRFHSNGDYEPGDFVMVRITRSASHNLIGEEIG
jgi:ribosomal protein S12 methylthiotransferase